MTMRLVVLADPAIGKAGNLDSVAVLSQARSNKRAFITSSLRATGGCDQRIEAYDPKGSYGRRT